MSSINFADEKFNFITQKNSFIMKDERIAGLVPAWKLGVVAMAFLMLVGMAS